MIRSIPLFIVSTFLGGLGGLLGSIVGSAAGKDWVAAGGILGGIFGSIASVSVARGRGWIPPQRHLSTSFGTALGFLIAAAIATHTLNSPVGPIASTLLIGAGAVLGARWKGKSQSVG
jgi:hypothetical protein